MKLVCGVGVNDAKYPVVKEEQLGRRGGKRLRKVVWRCPFYQTWKCMLVRCYSKKEKERHPTYLDAACCKEWLLFSNFKLWMEQQDWEGRVLDKDILGGDCKLYSPTTCAFVTKSANGFVLDAGAKKDNRMLGVSWNAHAQAFKATCRNVFNKSQEYLGYFDTSEEAHEAWRKRKHELAQLVAELETDPRVVEALKKRYSFEEWYGKG